MTVFEHNPRYRVMAAMQHPYRHTLGEFAFAHDALPGVTDLNEAMNYLFSVIYPRSQDSVATTADLPALGNTIGDYRVVLDDGDAKAAGYQWQQREGDAAAKWYKIYDMDWGTDGILSGFYQKTLDFYVYRKGYNDLDYLGVALTGDLAGQHIYGGATANTHLTFHANAGDGVGAQTGFIQFGDNARPLVDSTQSLGTTSYRWLKVWTDALTSGTMTLGDGSIVDSSGAISFDNENLLTTGTLGAGATTVASLGVVGSSTLSISNGVITNSTGTVGFADNILSTTGSVIVGSLTLNDASITDSSGSISFDNENLLTTGTLGAGVITGTQLNIDNLRLDGNTASAQSGALNLLAATVVDVQSAMTTIGQTVTGTLAVTGQLNADNLRLDGNTLSSTNTDGNIIVDPNGAGLVELGAAFFPTTDSTWDIGKSGSVWNKLWLDGSIGDGTTEITSAVLQSFRDANSGVSNGMTLFWSTNKWVASLPDTEVDHGTISGLGDDDHTQYALLAGRSGGQSLIGGTAASNNLNLESTSNGTKGKILAKDTFASFTDASYSGSWSGADLGGSSNRFRHVYTAGEFFGLRLENLASDPSPSSQNPGRLFWQTTDKYLGADNGVAAVRLSQFRFESDTSWNGSDVTKNVTVSGSITDARKALWQLKNNTNDFETMFVSCKPTSASNILITVNVALPAGSYRLVGIQ